MENLTTRSQYYTIEVVFLLSQLKQIILAMMAFSLYCFQICLVLHPWCNTCGRSLARVLSLCQCILLENLFTH